MAKQNSKPATVDTAEEEIAKLTEEAKGLMEILGAKDGDFNLDQNVEGLKGVIETLKDLQAEKELEAEAKAKAEAKVEIPEGAVNLINTTDYSHNNPYTNIRFDPGVRVEGVVLDSWTECQCDAGILELVD